MQARREVYMKDPIRRVLIKVPRCRGVSLRHQLNVAICGLAFLTSMGVTPASADAAFIKFLTGPWGKSTTSGEPVAAMIMKPGAPQFTRKSCPPSGVALKDMIENEYWFATLPDGRFVRVAGGGKMIPQEMKFQRLDGKDTAIFGFAVNALSGTIKVTRLSPTQIRMNLELGPMKLEEYFVRCKALSS